MVKLRCRQKSAPDFITHDNSLHPMLLHAGSRAFFGVEMVLSGPARQNLPGSGYFKTLRI